MGCFLFPHYFNPVIVVIAVVVIVVVSSVMNIVEIVVLWSENTWILYKR